MEHAQNFLESVLRTSNLVDNCIQEENKEFLELQIPKLLKIYLVFQSLSHRFRDKEILHGHLSTVLHLLRCQLVKCHQLLVRLTDTAPEVSLPIRQESAVGRPKLEISSDQIVLLKNSGLSWSKIARFFGIDRKTLFNFRRNTTLESLQRINPLSDAELMDQIASIKSDFPRSGYKYVMGCLKGKGIAVTWKRLIEKMRIIDPVGIYNRKRKRLHRRQYKVKGANYLW